MKKLLLIAGIVLCLKTASFGTRANAQNYSVTPPSMRVNRSAAMSITTSWQTVIFNGTSSNNFNQFPISPTNGNPILWFDSFTNLFRFTGEYNRNLSFQLFPRTTTTVISTPATLQMRIVVPNGVSPGVDKIFPFPDVAGSEYVDILDITKFTTSVNQVSVPITIYVNQAIKTNGFYVQLRLSNSLFTLGSCTMDNAALVLLTLN